MHGRLFKDLHVVKLEILAMLANDPIKSNNAINTCLINLNIILFFAFSLNIYEYPKHRQLQNSQKNYSNIHIILSAEKSFETMPKHNGAKFVS